MAPKSTPTQIDAKLVELRKFVEENQATLSQRCGTTLAKSLRQNQSADERKWYMFLTKQKTDFTAEQSEHLKQTFALLGNPSNAPTAGMTPPSSNEPMDPNDASAAASSSTEKSKTPSRSGVQPPTENASAAAAPSTRGSNAPPRSGVPPPTDDASAAPASSTQASITRYGTKRCTSGPIKQNAHTTGSGSKRKKSEHGNEDTASGSKVSAVKRKSSGSTPTASGATPPTQRPRTGEADETVETDKTTLTAENWAELHEFDAWLETPEATRLRKDHLHTDKQSVKHLLVHPPARVALQLAGSQLGVKRNHQTLVLWHDRCVQKALQHFRTWRQGGLANWLQKGAQRAAPDTMDTSLTVVETVTEMRQRRDYWWTTILTKSFRHCNALRTKHPQLLTGDAWETLLARFQLAMQNTNKTAIRRLCRKHKDFVLAAGVHMGHR